MTDRWVILYTDAPPHSRFHTRGESSLPNIKKEETLLGHHFDWMRLAQELRPAKVFTLTNKSRSVLTLFASVLGPVIDLGRDPTPETITKVTVELIVSVMGIEHAEFTGCPQKLETETISDEKTLVVSASTPNMRGKVRIAAVPSWSVEVKRLFAKFAEDPLYTTRVYDTLCALLNPNDVLSITYNHAFGLMWRTMCRNRKDPRTKEHTRSCATRRGCSSRGRLDLTHKAQGNQGQSQLIVLRIEAILFFAIEDVNLSLNLHLPPMC